jgi:hypothetical protein
MKKDAKIEEILLSDENYEKMVKEKTEQDFKKILETGNSATDKYITDIKSVPPDMLFSKFATYEVINKQSKTCTYINGVQAEGYLGANNSDRMKLLSGQTDSFVSEDMFVKFVKVPVSNV